MSVECLLKSRVESLSLSLSPNEIRNELAERSGEATRSQVPKSLRIPSVNLVVRLLFFAGNRHRALRCAWTNRKPVHGEPLRRRCEPKGDEEPPHPHPPRWLLPIVLFRTTNTSTSTSMATSYCHLPHNQHPHIHAAGHFLLFPPHKPQHHHHNHVAGPFLLFLKSRAYRLMRNTARCLIQILPYVSHLLSFTVIYCQCLAMSFNAHVSTVFKMSKIKQIDENQIHVFFYAGKFSKPGSTDLLS